MRRTQNARSNNYIVVKATVVPFGDSGFLEKSGQVSRGGIKFHVHPQLQLQDQTIIDSAINIGSSNAKDLMCYKLLQHGDATTLPGGILALLQGLNVGINPLTSGAIDYVALGITAPGDWFEAPPLLLPEADNRKYDSAELLHEALVAQDRHVQLLDTIFTQAATAQENVYVFGFEYSSGDGVHEIHMNQGFKGGPQPNSANSDGAVFIEHADGSWTSYYTAFNASSVPTDPSTGAPTDDAQSFNNAVQAPRANHNPSSQ